jgi:hypothetical protein
VLDLIGEGLTNRQIAERLFLAEKTVKNYVSALLAKLGLTRRVQAAVIVSEIKSDQARRYLGRRATSANAQLASLSGGGGAAAPALALALALATRSPIQRHAPHQHRPAALARPDRAVATEPGGPSGDVVQTAAAPAVRDPDAVVGDAQLQEPAVKTVNLVPGPSTPVLRSQLFTAPTTGSVDTLIRGLRGRCG